MKGCVRMALVAALVLAMPSLGRADDDAEITQMAKEHYKLGLDAYNAGNYTEAIKELKKAYLLKRLPALLLNIGATYRKMGDAANAVTYYKKYLAEAPNAKDRGDVEATVAELEHGGAGAPPAAAAAPTQWAHTPVDAAPPDQPLDVRVTMPITKGVKVYLYYRTAGESDFQPVIMKRHGGDKIGRIPAEAMTGKSLQYYIEGKDGAGNVVKSFGSAASPNVVMIDAGAQPQVVASSGDSGAADGNVVRADLDDEEAPITGAIEEKKERKHERAGGESRHARFGTAFWVGSALAAAGVAGVAVGGWGLYEAKSYADVLTADSMARDSNGNPYRFTDPTAQPYDDKTVERRGKFYNTLGIAMTVAGGVALAGGAVLIAVDRTVLQHKSERPKRDAWVAPAVGPTMAGIAGGVTF